MNRSTSHEAATRHIPVAHQRDASAQGGDDKPGKDARRASETRLQAAVGRRPSPGERDPYADVPCTD